MTFEFVKKTILYYHNKNIKIILKNQLKFDAIKYGTFNFVTIMTKTSNVLKIWTFSVENKYRLIYYNLVIKK